MVLLSGFNLVLSRVSGQEDILLGVPGAARQHQDLENIIGLFVNTLILRNHIKPKESFNELLERVRENMIQVLEYQGFPLELVCGELKIKYPGISTFFNLSTFGDIENKHLEDRESYHIEEVQEAKFDMVCYLWEYSDGAAIETHYKRELFKPVTIEKILRKYLSVLEIIAFGSEGKAKKKRKIKWKK
jgi:non-ribosomal peptide synthetase component F